MESSQYRFKLYSFHLPTQPNVFCMSVFSRWVRRLLCWDGTNQEPSHPLLTPRSLCCSTRSHSWYLYLKFRIIGLLLPVLIPQRQNWWEIFNLNSPDSAILTAPRDQHFRQQGMAVTVCSDWYLSQQVLAALGGVTHTQHSLQLSGFFFPPHNLSILYF